jgi:hypothetical protein
VEQVEVSSLTLSQLTSLPALWLGLPSDILTTQVRSLTIFMFKKQFPYQKRKKIFLIQTKLSELKTNLHSVTHNKSCFIQ